MRAVTIVILLVSICPSIISLARFQNFRVILKTSRSLSEVDYACDPIAPAVYVKDLYGALGVSRNATRDELKDAYWKIAAKSHPDRNKSIEALEIYRNASYAYNILGKDDKLRREYDSEHLTQDYIEALENLGTATSDLLVPLTFEVAVPLINMTAQMIGSFAVPMLKDAFEQSNAAIKAASSPEKETSINPFQRAALALEQKRLEQQYNKQSELLRSHEAKLIEAAQQYNIVIANEAKMEKSLMSLKKNVIDVNDNLSFLNRNKAIGKEQINKFMAKDMELRTSLSDAENSASLLIKASNELNQIIKVRKDEIARLEKLLAEQRKQLEIEDTKKAKLTEEFTTVQSTINGITAKRDQLNQESDNFSKEHISLCRRINECETLLKSYEDSIQSTTKNLSENRNMKSELTIKLDKLRKQKEALKTECDVINKKRIERAHHYF